jgi:uncharacterized membrane protein YphA (DoxX/SURF4 family)
MAYLIFALRIALGGILIVAGVLKAHDGPISTAITIAGYRILPTAFVGPLGIVLPYFEIMLGAYLVAGIFSRVAGWVAAVQFSMFALAVGSLVVRGISADCGCFGSSIATPPSWGHVAVDVVLALVAVAIALRAPGAFALDRYLFPSGYFATGRETAAP